MSSTSSSRRKVGSEDKRVVRLRYFHYRVHRVDVEPLLRRNGDFILRRMRYQGQEKYVVSVRWGGCVRHFPIEHEKDHNRYCFEAKGFDHIEKLIDWHINTGTSLTEAVGARLERPVPRQPWELLSKDIDRRKLLGKGNFGSVFQAMVNGKEAAMKTLDRVATGKEETVERARVEMLEEARTMRAVSGHENVVEAYGVTIDEELPVAVMEIVSGNSLNKKLQDDPLPVDVKVRLVKEAAAGLAHIHSKGYVHRDMAARNCLVEKTPAPVGRLKITDFGMARPVGQNGIFKLHTQSQMPVRWSALESLEKLEWSFKTDVWSLAVLAWEIFNDGALPFTEVVDFTLATAVPLLKEGKRLEIPPEVPKAVADVMQKSWDADPAKRPTAEQFHQGCTKK